MSIKYMRWKRIQCTTVQHNVWLIQCSMLLNGSLSTGSFFACSCSYSSSVPFLFNIAYSFMHISMFICTLSQAVRRHNVATWIFAESLHYLIHSTTPFQQFRQWLSSRRNARMMRELKLYNPHKYIWNWIVW